MRHKYILLLAILTVSTGAAFAGKFWGTKLSLSGQVTSNSSVIDDGDTGFTTNGEGWKHYLHAQGYQNDLLAPVSTLDPALSATWTFTNVQPGEYAVYVTYKAYSILTSRAPYTIFDGPDLLGTATVNQKTDPTDHLFDGRNWALLGTFVLQGPILSITLTRPEDLSINGVMADAARIELTTPPPSSHLSPPSPDLTDSPVSPTDIATTLPACGNGTLETDEECDPSVPADGRVSDGPGNGTDIRCGNDCRSCLPPPLCPTGTFRVDTALDARGCLNEGQCLPCPAFDDTSCPDGILLAQSSTDPLGCPLPPVCCTNALQNAQCTAQMNCQNGVCLIQYCFCPTVSPAPSVPAEIPVPEPVPVTEPEPEPVYEEVTP